MLLTTMNFPIWYSQYVPPTVVTVQPFETAPTFPLSLAICPELSATILSSLSAPSLPSPISSPSRFTLSRTQSYFPFIPSTLFNNPPLPQLQQGLVAFHERCSFVLSIFVYHRIHHGVHGNIISATYARFHAFDVHHSVQNTVYVNIFSRAFEMFHSSCCVKCVQTYLTCSLCS